MMRVSILPVAAAVVLGLGTAPLPAAGAGIDLLNLLVLDSAEIPRAGRGGTAKLRGLDVTFDFHSSGDTIGYSWQCAGLRYPGGAWPSHCSVMLSGPSIERIWGVCGRTPRHVRVECSPECEVRAER